MAAVRRWSERMSSDNIKALTEKRLRIPSPSLKCFPSLAGNHVVTFKARDESGHRWTKDVLETSLEDGASSVAPKSLISAIKLSSTRKKKNKVKDETIDVEFEIYGIN
ncbi:hypothetical protein J1N35_016162 [Gossypium stocksii]|uniref:Uncharacterized protein n=1 Tax=Gossypium stocksii TaxID=47602 RepID=A0A9D3VZS0_9ROSI|nr:hypothetical protein J1N35_016162 [Gossypium stocksii]